LINSWKKKLAITDLGLGKTHDKYLNIPKKAFFGTDQNPTEFYNIEPGRPDNHVFVNHIDKKTGDIYRVRFEYAKKSKQTRLYQLAGCYHARKPKPGDQIIVEKISKEGGELFMSTATKLINKWRSADDLRTFRNFVFVLAIIL
jgi:hypothetical protein